MPMCRACRKTTAKAHRQGLCGNCRRKLALADGHALLGTLQDLKVAARPDEMQ